MVEGKKIAEKGKRRKDLFLPSQIILKSSEFGTAYSQNFSGKNGPSTIYRFILLCLNKDLGKYLFIPAS